MNEHKEKRDDIPYAAPMHGASQPHQGSVGYERSDTSGRAIFAGMAASILIIAIVSIVLNEFFLVTREDIMQDQVWSRSDPRLSEVRAIDARNLGTYEWIDQGAGTVRIPIDRAMELMAEEAYVKRSEQPATGR